MILRKLCASPLTAASVLFLFTFLFFCPATANPFFTRGEAREALVVQAMVNQQNLILPLRNGADIPSKPPLFHWVGYATSKATQGVSEAAIRFPSVLATALQLVVFLGFFAKRLGLPAATLAVLILLTSLDFLRLAPAARVDMVFSFWTATATWLLFESLSARERVGGGGMRHSLAAGVGLGLAALTKGPAGLALPVAVAGVYALVTGSRRGLPIARLSMSVAIGLLVAIFWYLQAYLQGGQRFLDVHLMRENIARIVGMDEYETGHDAGPLSVVGMILSGLLPWTIFIPLVSVRLWKGRSNLRTTDRASLFCLIWAAFYLALFAFTASKRNVYLLPSYPAYAYLFGSKLCSGSSESPKLLRFAAWCLVVYGAVLSVATLLLLAFPWVDYQVILSQHSLKLEIVDIVWSIAATPICYTAGLLISAAIVFSASKFLFSRELANAIPRIIAAQLVLSFSLSLGVMAQIAKSQSPKAELPSLLAQLPENAELYQYRQDFYAIDFYANRNIKTVLVKPNVSDGKVGYIFVSEDELPAAQAILQQAEVVARSVKPIVYGKQRIVLLKFS